MGMVNGEELQLCMFCSVCMVGLRVKNDLVNMTDDETVGSDLAKIMTTFQNKPGQNLVTFNSSDVVAAGAHRLAGSGPRRRRRRGRL